MTRRLITAAAVVTVLATATAYAAVTPIPPESYPPNCAQHQVVFSGKTLQGGSTDDTLKGTANRDILRGGNGADALLGRKGAIACMGREDATP